MEMKGRVVEVRNERVKREIIAEGGGNIQKNQQPWEQAQGREPEEGVRTRRKEGTLAVFMQLQRRGEGGREITLSFFGAFLLFTAAFFSFTGAVSFAGAFTLGTVAFFLTTLASAS